MFFEGNIEDKIEKSVFFDPFYILCILTHQMWHILPTNLHFIKF